MNAPQATAADIRSDVDLRAQIRELKALLEERDRQNAQLTVLLEQRTQANATLSSDLSDCLDRLEMSALAPSLERLAPPVVLARTAIPWARHRHPALHRIYRLMHRKPSRHIAHPGRWPEPPSAAPAQGIAAAAATTADLSRQNPHDQGVHDG